MKKATIAILVMVLLFALSGCGSSANYDERLTRIEERLAALESQQSGATFSATDLVGVWKNDQYVYTFNGDETGSIQYVSTGGKDIIIYSTERKNTLIIGYFASTEEYRYTIKGNTLTITGDGRIVELTKQE